MKNTNCLKDVMCPSCGNTEKFQIIALVDATVTDEGVQDYLAPEWDDNSNIFCSKCLYHGLFMDFTLPGFSVTFQTVTPESASQGVVWRSGWLNEDPIQGKPDELSFVFDPDSYDSEEHDSLDDAIVQWAVELLKKEGATYSNEFPGDCSTGWSTEGTEVLNYKTMETRTLSYHFEGFSDELRVKVNKQMES